MTRPAARNVASSFLPTRRRACVRNASCMPENGHQITTIAPPPKQVVQLAEQFWSDLESVPDGRQLTLGRKVVNLSAGMFAVGDYGYRIEIWRVGQINPWYHWKELDPSIADFHADRIKPSSGPELPERLRRFWKEPDSAAAAKVA